MAMRGLVSRAQIERDLVALMAGQRMGGTEPRMEDVEVARRVLSGEITADEAVRMRLAQIDAQFGITR